jgi:glycosyltransferase involved in cell wall biosynthesis
MAWLLLSSRWRQHPLLGGDPARRYDKPAAGVLQNKPAAWRRQPMTGSVPIKVLLIRDHLAPAGGTTYLLETLPQFDPARVRPSLCVLEPSRPAARAFEAAGIRPVFLERRTRDPRGLLDLLRLVRARRPDLLFLSGPKSNLLGRLVARWTGVPAILRLNNMLPEAAGIALLQRRLASGTAAGVAVSHAVKHWASHDYALPPERIRVIYEGRNVDGFAAPAPDARARIRDQLGIGEDAALIGLIGRVLSSQKGQDLMIRRMPELRRRRPDAVLLIVGNGPDLEVCRRLAAWLGLNDAVRFFGYRDDMPDILAAVDVVVVPSFVDEGFPFVALEASAAGRPVVAFRSGVLAEAVVHDDSGLLVPKGDADGLADAIVRVLGDPALARRLAEHGRRHAAGFTVARNVQGLTDLFEEVARQARPSSLRAWRRSA